MIRPRDLTGSPLVRWQFPDLDGPARRSAMPPPPRAEDAAIGAASLAGEAEAAEPGNGSEAPSPADLVVAEIARGHAEGVERGLAEGRAKGHAEGFAAGARAAEEALAGEARRLAAIVQRLSAPLPVLERAVEEAVVALALEVARAVIGGEIARSRDSLVPLIREAIAKVPIEMGALEVVLNPADLDLVRALAPEIEEGSAALVGDAAIEAGGCVVVGRNEAKDLRWHSRPREGLPQVDLSLAARWRNVMLALFDGEAG